MECPHCGAETLMGATSCVACGQSMFGRPQSAPPQPAPTQPAPAPAREPSPFGADAAAAAPPASTTGDDSDRPRPPPVRSMQDEFRASSTGPAPVELPAQPRRALCTVCYGPCEDSLTNVCDTCQARAAMAAQPSTPAASFSNRMGTAAFRPPPPRRGPTAGQRAARAIIWGGLLVAAGFGVVHYVRPEAPGAQLSRDARSERIVVDFAMPRDPVLRYSTTLDVQILREQVPNTFDTSLMTIFDLRQRSSYDHEVMLVRDEGGAAVLDVRTVCKLDSQTGRWEQKDGSTRPVYPWPERIEVERVRVRPGAAMARTAGGEPLPARDVPPLLAFGHVGGPSGELSPGQRWQATVLLPCVATRAGAIAPISFRCELRYVGRRVMEGRACAIVKLEAKPLAALDDRFEHLDGAGGRVAGALAYDSATGLLVSADLQIDAHVSHGGGKPDERVSTKGMLRVTRE